MKRINYVQAQKYTKWILKYFLSAFVIPMIFAMALYVYDPLMLFHKPINREVTLANDMRSQAAGIIHSMNYDSYILGTSVLENTSADRASNIIGGNFANISISGSNYFERKFTLAYALEKGAKKIIYSLDSHYLEPRLKASKYQATPFSFIYSDSPYRLRFYLQPKYILCVLIWSESEKCVGQKKTADRPNSWIGKKEHYSRFGGLDNWFSGKNSSQIKAAFTAISVAAKRVQMGESGLINEAALNSKKDNAIQYIEENLISYVRANPATQFHFIFPPYSRIQYAQWHQLLTTDAKVHEAIVRYLAKTATKLSNLSVYGYENQGFLDNISNYKDTVHYHEWVNDLMLNDIANNKSFLTSSNVDKYLEKARSKALAFDLVRLGNKIDDYLSRNVDE
jgi:hypothetical protein